MEIFVGGGEGQEDALFTYQGGRLINALITLATTGDPDPLQAELGGTVMSSEDLQMKIGNLLDLEKEEHLAPKALVTPTEEPYAMVAPTITKGPLKNSKMFDRDDL